MKAVQVYLTKKNYKIMTMYRLESWSYIISEPIYILPKEVEVKELSSKIFDALQSSKQLLESEEEQYRLGNKLFLQTIKESSLNKFYEASKSCGVYKNGNKICIEPYKFDGKDQGISVIKDRILELDSTTESIEVTKIIIDILK